MARLYANENFPLQVVEALSRMGHDVLTTFAAGKAGQSVPDEHVFAFAIEDRRALLTLNRRHFLRLAHALGDHSGLTVCTFDPDYARQAQTIDDELNRHPSLVGQILRINRPPR